MSLEVIKSVGGTNLWEIKTDKGQLPKVLQGQYTDSVRAKKALETY